MLISPDSFPFWIILGFGSLGAASLGSFYVTLGFRILETYYGKQRKLLTFFQKWKRIFTLPSSCDHCGKKIRYPELLPIIGFFISKGTCKYCNKKIYILFPLVEFLFVCIFVFCFTITKNLSFSFTFLFLCGHLLISCLTDAFHFSLDYENLPWILCFGVISIFLLDGKLPGLNDLFVLGGFFSLSWFYFFLSGRDWIRGRFICPNLCFYSRSSLVDVFLNASYIPAVLFTIILRERGKSIRKTPIPMGLYFGIGLFLLF
ncbi:peptidase A24, N-terminal domain protein [Leptospira interrogans serovar Zanoni str. LT2156]|uniref:Peptidase A24, N-terminal domain protein n=1 Tax=Leptospira interrogans serovar Zanoni str. LT2156 TaxID=1001601 RepID=M6HJ84_LEPIR|nr:peptidase A24, N-terminal domain protein [Leptospira interrogans serovar Zanoni str. LT2156]